ncbi:MAG TPA: hypothetical protein VMU48_01165 [Terracidiphilus sp.]|nr:hypothetical protein [Terracidiphilus sp.]
MTSRPEPDGFSREIRFGPEPQEDGADRVAGEWKLYRCPPTIGIEIPIWAQPLMRRSFTAATL